MTVDEILARGRYTDRRGRMWAIAMADGRWGATDGRYLIGGRPFSVDRMRLLIERDQHRDVCHRKGASHCPYHPVPIVYWEDSEGAWMARPAGGWPRGEDVPLYFDFNEVMDAAYDLAVANE